MYLNTIDGGSADADHIVIYNNLIRNPQDSGIILAGSVSNTDLYYNTVFADSNDLTGSGDEVLYVHSTAFDVVIKNNIFYNGSTGTDGFLIFDQGSMVIVKRHDISRLPGNSDHPVVPTGVNDSKVVTLQC